MTSGQETEWIYSYNPRARTGPKAQKCSRANWGVFKRAAAMFAGYFLDATNGYFKECSEMILQQARS